MTTWGAGLAFWEALCLPVSYELGVYAEQAHPYINNSIRAVYFRKNARLHCGHAKGRSEVSTVNLHRRGNYGSVHGELDAQLWQMSSYRICTGMRELPGHRPAV